MQIAAGDNALGMHNGAAAESGIASSSTSGKSLSESDDQVVTLVGSNLDLLDPKTSTKKVDSPTSSCNNSGGAFYKQHKYKPKHIDTNNSSWFTIGNYFSKSTLSRLDNETDDNKKNKSSSGFAIGNLFSKSTLSPDQSEEDLFSTKKHARPKDYFDQQASDNILEERYTGFLGGLKNRLQDSNLTKYFLHRTLDPEEADEAVDSLALINALLLTIPFQAMAIIGHDYWDWLQEMIETCNKQHYPKNTWIKIYQDTQNCFYALTYTAVAAVSIAAFYYLARPKNYDKFQIWWNKGAQKVIILMLFCTIVATWSTMALFVTTFNNYANSSDNFCSLYDEPSKNAFTRSAWSGNAFLMAVILLALYWMI